ncbi:MAG: protoporphyrinogen/coproporphyrinogen oxidase [Agrococcus casei]|uniref:protoporphyrinogen/coproporphyrinogen oxidase n=1 Tax=Agrococcus casei TaxID=343512 RepID=UPI003F91243F
MTDVAVVGAGIGGLVAARELAKAGLTVELFEAAPVVGGLVGAMRVGETAVDSGPESFATRGGAVGELVDELGLTRVDAADLGSWLVFDDGAAPSPAGALMGIPADVTAADVVRVIGAEASQRALRDLELPAQAGTASGMLGELVRERLGETVLDRLVDPIVSGVYSARADDLPVSRVSPKLLDALAEHGSLQAAVRQIRGGGAGRPSGSRPGALVQGIDGGMHRLAEALAADFERLGGRLRLGHRVDDITMLDARAVVVATPDWASEARGAEVELVTLAFEAGAIDGAPRGTGALVAPGAASISAKALTHSSAKWPWLRASAPHLDIVRLSYGRQNQPPPTSCLDDEATVALAHADAERILGQSLPAPVFTGRRALRQPPAPGAVQPPDGVLAVGSWVAGTGLASVVPASIAVAKELSQRLAPSTGGLT